MPHIDPSHFTLGEMLCHRSPEVQRHAKGCLIALQKGNDAIDQYAYYRYTPHLFQPSLNTAPCDTCHDENVICNACGRCYDCDTKEK